jgi:hypothetical protein
MGHQASPDPLDQSLTVSCNEGPPPPARRPGAIRNQRRPGPASDGFGPTRERTLRDIVPNLEVELFEGPQDQQVEHPGNPLSQMALCSFVEQNTLFVHAQLLLRV